MSERKYTREDCIALLTDKYEELQKKGYTIVPISELIYMNDYTIDTEGRQHQTNSPQQ